MEGAVGVCLSIDNGHSNSSKMVEPVGSKRFKLMRPGITRFVLTVERDGRKRNYRAMVFVRRMKVTRSETVDEKGRRMTRLRTWWQHFRNRLGYNWRVMTPKRRLAVVMLCALLLLVVLIRYLPRLFFFGVFLLSAYLLWVILKG